MDRFIQALKNEPLVECYFDPIHKRAYSVDASIYEIEPFGIAIPKTKEGLNRIVRIANDYQVPIIARGAATGITGGCLGIGLIIDTSCYLNRILDIDLQQETVTVEPGVILDRLNEALAPKGYWLGPETSTGNRATIGGMIANNAAGSRSLRYGKMVDHVKSLELVVSSGESLRFQAIDDRNWEQKRKQNNQEGEIYREIHRIRQVYGNEIRKSFPNIPRRVSGYNLDELLKNEPLNVSKLITGSEGTLGIISEATLTISKKPPHLGIAVIHFDNLLKGMSSIGEILPFHPVALEMIDDKIIEMGRISPSMKAKLSWLKGNPSVLFVAEFDGNDSMEMEAKLRAFVDAMKEKNIGYHIQALTDKDEMQAVWDVRKEGLGLLLSKRSYKRAIAFIEDLSLPPERLHHFFVKFLALLKKHGKEAGIYGHVGSGCMHIRPYIDLTDGSELAIVKTLMEEVSSLVLEFHGALSGEHGDGIIRAWLNEKMFGFKVYTAFKELKTAFDPSNLMNPGKIVDGLNPLENLRISPDDKIYSVKTFLDFSKEGGIELAADLCNGNGLCRKKEKLMCPSFQASGNEYDTTRARAQALRALFLNRLPDKDLSSEGLHDVLDLCLSCKGCKTECPSQVDMAKMKAEALYHYRKKHGLTLRDRLFGSIHSLFKYASPFASIANFALSFPFLKKFLKVSPKRDLPALAKIRFSEWFNSYEQAASLEKKAVLLNDTYTEFISPQIGQAAVKVLNGLGYFVILPPLNCCGRPYFSKGMLEEAKSLAIQLARQLSPYARLKLPIVGLEPSCVLTLRDEFSALLDDKDLVQVIQNQSMTFDEFLFSHLKDEKLPLDLIDEKTQVKVHGHCHEKALVGMKPTLTVLKAIPGFDVVEIPSGCCGMAGAFGYEEEHYEFSLKIGKLTLFPAIDKASSDTLIVANGFSCRSQIAHGTSREARHLAEIIADRIKTKDS